MIVPAYECGDCKFWEGYFEGGGASLGECRRFPPNNPATEGIVWKWPVVRHIDWCGEFVASEEATFNDPVSGAALRDPITGQKLP